MHVACVCISECAKSRRIQAFFSTFCILLSLNGVYRFFVEVSLIRIFDTVHAFRFIIMLYKWYLQRDLKWRSDLMRPFWLPALATPVEDVASAVCIILVAYEDDFQVQRGECEQQYSRVSTLVESVLDIRRPAKILSAVVWTPNNSYNEGNARHHCDFHYYSSEPPETWGTTWGVSKQQWRWWD